MKQAAANHRAVAISLIGSVARGADTPGSDIDFLVDFEPNASLMDVCDLELALQGILGEKVDVVDSSGDESDPRYLRRKASMRRDEIPL